MCPTLCDRTDCSPPGSSVHGDSPGKNTGVSCHFLLQSIFLTQWSNLCLLHWQYFFKPPGRPLYVFRECKLKKKNTMRCCYTQNGQNLELWQYQMLVTMWSNRISDLLLVGVQNGTTTLEDSLVVSYKTKHQIRSDQIRRSVVSDSLRPHESQHARPPCPPTPGVHWDSTFSVVPFSSCPQSVPASESFPKSQLFTWGGQSTAVSALASFLPKKSQGWSPSVWTGWISLQSKGLSRVFSNTTVQKHQTKHTLTIWSNFCSLVFIQRSKTQKPAHGYLL